MKKLALILAILLQVFIMLADVAIAGAIGAVLYYSAKGGWTLAGVAVAALALYAWRDNGGPFFAWKMSLVKKILGSFADIISSRAPYQEPIWIVNDNAELGVKVGGRFFFLYKGQSLEYEDGLHDDGEPMLWRPVGKREFGETCRPLNPIWVDGRYICETTKNPGLDFPHPEGFYDWKPLPVAPPKKENSHEA
jgi:hypothetical protein